MDTQTRLRQLVESGQAGTRDLDTLGQAEVEQIKAQPDSLQIRATAGEAPTQVEDRTLRYILSDETPDRMGDVIRQQGWELGQFRKNPVILWGHKSDAPPIGRATKLDVVARMSGPALVADIEFAPKDASPMAETVYQLASRGFLPANSVGFSPGETRSPADEEERKEIGLGRYGGEFTRGHELLENSLVSVPANPNALQDGVRSLRGSGVIGQTEAREFLGTFPLTEMDYRRALESAARELVQSVEDLVEEEDPGKWGELEERLARLEEMAAEMVCKANRMEQAVDALAIERAFSSMGAPNFEQAPVDLTSGLFSRIRERIKGGHSV